MPKSQDSSEDYTALVAAYSKVFTAPKEQADEHLEEVQRLSEGMDKATIKDAMAEAAVMAVADGKMMVRRSACCG